LIDHNYEFETTAAASFDNVLKMTKKDEDSTLAGQLRKRETKCDLKIAEAIEKLKRTQYHMDFYDSLSGSGTNDVQKTLTSTIVA